MNRIIKTALLACSALTVCVVLQTSTYSQAKGTDATEITIAASGLMPETIYRQAGGKSWQVISRGNVTQTCNETNRDEWSVYLTCPEVTVVLDLFKKERSIIGTAGSTLKSPIASSSNAPVAAPPPDTGVTSATRSGETTPSRPSPLTINQMEHVMRWISVKTSAARLPFCWRQSKGRGAGVSMVCSRGYVQEGGHCFTPCKADERGIDEICYKNCPAGFRDDGLYCGKPAAYSRGAGYVIWDRAKCEKENPQGCEQGGAIWYPKCRAGFHGVVTQCSVSCPAGFEDIGVSCKKPTNKRGVRYLTDCAPGLEKSGALCYPACEPGSIAGIQEANIDAGPPNKYKGVGPVCWQNCPSQQNFDCGAGCATTKGQCAKSVLTMTTAPIIAALKIGALIATFGGSSGATAGAGVTAAGAKVGIAGPKLAKLAAMADKLQRLYKANETAIKTASATKTILGAIKSETDLFAAEFAKNFGDMTSPEIEKEIDDWYSKDAAFEIKKAWGVRHLGMMMEANAIVTTKNVIDVAGIADPTGLVGVVSAFTNPLCRDDTPFPKFKAKY